MIFRRRHRWATVLLVLAALLFQQFAMAAYVCHLDQAALQGHTESTQPPCHDDRNDRARCEEHCHPTRSSAAHSHHPLVPPCAIAPADVFLAAAVAPAPVSAPLARGLEVHATSPPLSIRFCTFLI